ncbi:Helix-turn-helix domain containing protein, type 11 [Citreicella sp. SE45]|uniref:WYL domain-containing protein n=1 Tax=Salipiger thiooxidans TaxID=282683 RepID=A0A1G7HSZ1_9RHOB|nr:HTH domain-containing protein [Salipiger thiooxidans]EEX14211.1 Helix-turn-helix domain containing protein, type 11 [Citreicella sp. SE45]SDF03545.1 WYL domain-containing protein [Salipiger thiooxidans]
MKKTDRLYALMTRLKDGGVHTAEALAAELGVSQRTIYRDMDTLAASGIAIEGTRGRGYAARASLTLPPLNLTETELEVLHLGLAAVGAGAGDLPELAEAARSLSRKIDALLPEDGTAEPGSFGFAAYPFHEAAQGFRHMPAVRAAIRARQKLRVTLRDTPAPQDLRPLALDYWGRIWTCTAWNETQGDFTTLRLDRITALAPLPGLFVDEPGKRLGDYTATRT